MVLIYHDNDGLRRLHHRHLVNFVLALSVLSFVSFELVHDNSTSYMYIIYRWIYIQEHLMPKLYY